MNPDELEAIFRTQMAAYAASDVDRLVDSFTDDCVLRDMTDPANPYVGREQVRGFLEGYFAVLRDVDVKITAVAVSDGLVIGELDVTGEYTGHPFSPENPRHIQLHYCVAEEIREGRVAHERFYWDSGHFEQQLKVGHDDASP